MYLPGRGGLGRGVKEGCMSRRLSRRERMRVKKKWNGTTKNGVGKQRGTLKVE